MKLILFEKSRVELEFVFSIFTTRVRKHFGNSGRFGPLEATYHWYVAVVILKEIFSFEAVGNVFDYQNF